MSTKSFHMKKLKTYTPLDDSQTAEKLKHQIVSDIKKKMNDSNISASELARLTGISRAYVSRILNHQVNLTVSMLAKVYQGLDCSIHVSLNPINDHEKWVQMNVIKDDDNLMMCA